MLSACSRTEVYVISILNYLNTWWRAAVGPVSPVSGEVFLSVPSIHLFIHLFRIPTFHRGRSAQGKTKIISAVQTFISGPDVSDKATDQRNILFFFLPSKLCRQDFVSFWTATWPIKARRPKTAQCQPIDRRHTHTGPSGFNWRAKNRRFARFFNFIFFLIISILYFCNFT